MISTLDQPSLMIPDDSFAVPLKESRHGNHTNSQSSFERAPQSMEKRPLAALMCGLPGPAQPDRRGLSARRDPTPGFSKPRAGLITTHTWRLPQISQWVRREQQSQTQNDPFSCFLRAVCIRGPWSFHTKASAARPNKFLFWKHRSSENVFWS